MPFGPGEETVVNAKKDIRKYFAKKYQPAQAVLAQRWERGELIFRYLY
jgi:hypothetical protein